MTWTKLKKKQKSKDVVMVVEKPDSVENILAGSLDGGKRRWTAAGTVQQSIGSSRRVV